MIEKREKEWQILESKAHELLDDPHRLPKDALLKFYRPVLRLWIYPSFAPYKVWIFNEPDFRTIEPKTILVRQVFWDRSADAQRLSSPLDGLKKGFHTEPKLEIESIDIRKEVFERIFSELKQVQFPAFANYRNSVGVDGIRYGVETFDFTHRTRISWWSVYPEEWQNLIDWFERTTGFLETEFLKI